MNIGMDNQSERVMTNNTEVQGRSPLSSAISSRDPSMVSSEHSTPYHDRIDIDLDNAPATRGINNEHLDLFYKTEQENALRKGNATIQQDTTRPPATNNEATSSHVPHVKDIINIQLPYDP